MHTKALHIHRLGLVTVRPFGRCDRRRHGLAAYVDGGRHPVGTAELVRDPDRSTHAAIGLAVAEDDDGAAIGRALVELLATDARAAGITTLTESVPAPDEAYALRAA